MALTLLLIVGSGAFHRSFRIPILVLPCLVVAFFILLALLASGVAQIH